MFMETQDSSSEHTSARLTSGTRLMEGEDGMKIVDPTKLEDYVVNSVVSKNLRKAAMRKR